MLRKLHIAFVVVLMLGAVASGTAWAASLLSPPNQDFPDELGYTFSVRRGRRFLPYAPTESRFPGIVALALNHRSSWTPISEATRDIVLPSTGSDRNGQPAVDRLLALDVYPVPGSQGLCPLGGWSFGAMYDNNDNRDLRGTDSWSPPTAEAKCSWWIVYVPLWATTLVLAIYPCVLLANNRLRRRYRLRHGLCLRCGYDLRGSLEAGRCPECGTGFEKPMPDRPKL